MQDNIDKNTVGSIENEQNESNPSDSFARILEDYKIAKLLQADDPAQLGELEQQINVQLKMLEDTEHQQNQTIVEKMVDLGMLCEHSEKVAGKKSIYTKWIREKIGADKLQIIQQCRRLAAKAEFCKAHSFLGKNRLLALLSLLQEDGAAELMKKYPLPGTANSELVKTHADAVTTLCRTSKEGIDVLNFDQALLIARTKGHALEVNQVKKLAGKLKDSNIDKAEYLENWIMNGCVFRNGEASEKPSGISQIIAQVNKITSKYDLNDTTILSDVKAEDILAAYQAICALAQKINLDLTQSNQTANTLMAA